MKDRFFTFKQKNVIKKQYHIAIVTIPTAGHTQIVKRLVEEAKLHNANLDFTFILTSWSGHTIRENDLIGLEKASGKKVVVLESKTTADNKGNNLGRARELTDEVIKLCSGYDRIIYDFMAPEGFIAGQVLSIPAFCADPSYIGKFDRSSQAYCSERKKSADDIYSLEEKYKLDLFGKLELISGTLSFRSPYKNLLFSWKNFIYANDFEYNLEEEKESCCFMRPSTQEVPPLDDKFSYISEQVKLGKKIVYFSLGTIVSGIVWDVTKELPDNSMPAFIKLLYQLLIKIFEKREDLILIISTGRNIDDLIDDTPLPKNIYHEESLPQASLLHHIDLFITHCGANSANEAIDAETPMVGIPFMFDQPECAKAIKRMEIGDAFSPEENEGAVNFETNNYFREPFYPNNLENAQKKFEETIDKMLNHDFSAAFATVKSGKTLTFASIPQILNLDDELFLEQQKDSAGTSIHTAKL